MRFFKGLGEQQLTTKFYQLPTEFTKDSDKEQLAYCLGATLYMPAMKPMIAQTLIANLLNNFRNLAHISAGIYVLEKCAKFNSAGTKGNADVTTYKSRIKLSHNRTSKQFWFIII